MKVRDVNSTFILQRMEEVGLYTTTPEEAQEIAESLTFRKDQYIRNGQAFLLVYAVNNRSSFRELEALRNSVLRVKDADWVPMVLVGLHCDKAIG
jgi:GTPase SAR1 family protein